MTLMGYPLIRYKYRPSQIEITMANLQLNVSFSSMQVDPYAKEPKNRFLFEQLESLVQARDDTIIQIRQSEKEVMQLRCIIIIIYAMYYLYEQTESILNARAHEESHTTLSISVYDVVRNETARKHRQEQERKLAEEEQIRKEKERDYLAPFLARIGDPVELTMAEKEKVAQVSISSVVY